MQCSHLTCTKPATIRCSACKISGYCSEEHQKDDWKVGRHALVCSQMQVNGPMDDATPMEVSNRSFFLGTSKVITPEMLTSYYSFELAGRGSFGVVLHARVRTSPVTEFALKLTFGAPEIGHREAAVGHLMTTLYAACDDPVGALLPVVKVYDSGYAVWTAEEARRFLDPFVWRGAGVPDYPREVLAARIGGSVQTSMMLMEYSTGLSLAEYIDDVARRQPQQQAEKLILDVLVQLLLVLSDLQTALEFVHYDLHTSNVMVETVPSGSMVWHFTASSDTAFNVRTNVRPRLLDFGFARLRRGSTFYASRSKGYYVEGGTLADYRPWADLHMLAHEIIGDMGKRLYDGLAPTSNLLFVLSKMLDMEVTPTDGAAGYLGLRRGIQAKLHPYDSANAVSFEQMQEFSKMAKLYVVQAKPDSPSTTAYSVLKDSQTALAEYISYKPVDTDTIVLMSLQVGRSSLATKSAWKAVEKAAARSWWSALGSL